MAPVIELDDLSVRLGGRTILDSLCAALEGRCIGLLGPNGSGKSTLINTLLGFYPPERGTGRLFGTDIRTGGKELRRGIGYMPENDSFIATMSGVRFVRYMAELSGLPPGEAMERAHEAFYYVGLGEVRYRKISTYSLGMKQLVKLAQALAHGPRLLLLDEPTNGLDPPARLRMLQLIREVRDAGQVRILLSSHLLNDVDEVCDEVLILKNGRVAAVCNLEEERRANLRILEMETVNADDAFAEAVEALGIELARFSRGRMKLVLPENVGLRELYRIAAERKVQIRRMSHRRDSLEDIFLKAMENGNAAGNLAQAAGKAAHGRS
jgi:ABC-2 type transport system ATP-binding protein